VAGIGGREIHIGLCWSNLKKRDPLEGIGIDEGIIL
jgi:hypothetical protein